LLAALLYLVHKLERADAYLLVAIYFIVLQFVLITALALLFSTFSSPLLSAVFAFSAFVIGTFSEDLRGLAASATGITKWFATVAAYAVPNFAAFNVVSRVAHSEPVATNLIVLNSFYTLVYSVAVLAAAILIFQRRDLK
jgi:hypothetical protein